EMCSSRRSFTRPYAGRTEESSSLSINTPTSTSTAVPSSSKKADKVSEEQRLKAITAGINQKKALKENNTRKTLPLLPSSREQNKSTTATKGAPKRRSMTL
ncbi:hypothetical protein PFISCL1PPCAC_20769, partial [Pristionchus fissidentatus]